MKMRILDARIKDVHHLLDIHPSSNYIKFIILNTPTFLLKRKCYGIRNPAEIVWQ